jgi:hypothetical protein
MTVGELKEFLYKNNLPNDAQVFYQRIEDTYFEKNGWKTIKKEGENYYYLLRWNTDIDSGKYLDKEEYPKMKKEYLVKSSAEDLEQSKEEYIPAWCAVKYPNDDNLYIDAHY